MLFRSELLAAGVDELLEPEAVLDELLLEQPATAIAASATAVRAKRRMFNSLVSWSRARSAGPGSSTETLAATALPSP